jgi:S1-C subfamily serine protease
VSLVPLTDAARATYHLPPGIAGALIDRVALLGAEGLAGIQVGDVVLRVGNDRVSSPAQVRAKLAEVRARGDTSVVILLQTGNRPHWVAVPLRKI